MKKKIYIAGKVTGEPKLECAVKFNRAQLELSLMGFEPINPLSVVGSWDTSWKEAMKLCIAALMDCDAIYLLPCADNSRGALLEKNIALGLGIPFYKDGEFQILE